MKDFYTKLVKKSNVKTIYFKYPSLINRFKFYYRSWLHHFSSEFFQEFLCMQQQYFSKVVRTTNKIHYIKKLELFIKSSIQVTCIVPIIILLCPAAIIVIGCQCVINALAICGTYRSSCHNGKILSQASNLFLDIYIYTSYFLWKSWKLSRCLLITCREEIHTREFCASCRIVFIYMYMTIIQSLYNTC